jgi:peroxiredoxin
MPATSHMTNLGAAAPDFRLPDVDGGTVARDDFADAPALLVMFICNHCPFVKHVRNELARLAEQYQRRGVAVVGISSNDPEQYPEDGPDAMATEARAAGYTFPYLFDESQDVARAYGAACTPDFFVYDRDRRLVYRGQLDGSRPGNDVPVNGSDLRAALDAVLAGEPVDEVQHPSVGCSIKWRQ